MNATAGRCGGGCGPVWCVPRPRSVAAAAHGRTRGAAPAGAADWVVLAGVRDSSETVMPSPTPASVRRLQAAEGWVLEVLVVGMAMLLFGE